MRVVTTLAQVPVEDVESPTLEILSPLLIQVPRKKLKGGLFVENLKITS